MPVNADRSIIHSHHQRVWLRSTPEIALTEPICNCYSLRQATRRVTQLYDQALAPLDLRSTQFTLLSEIRRLGPISLISLAQVMVIDRATLGHNVRPLQSRGLLKLTVGQDRRSRELTLTKAGRAILTDAGRLWKQAQSRFESEIGHKEAGRLRALLHRVSSAEFVEH